MARERERERVLSLASERERVRHFEERANALLLILKGNPIRQKLLMGLKISSFRDSKHPINDRRPCCNKTRQIFLKFLSQLFANKRRL